MLQVLSHETAELVVCFWRHAGAQKIHLTTERFERARRGPVEPLRNRRTIDIIGGDQGSAPPASSFNMTVQKLPNCAVLRCKLRYRGAAKPGVLVKRIERHSCCHTRRRDWYLLRLRKARCARRQPQQWDQYGDRFSDLACDGRSCADERVWNAQSAKVI
jgi:hypothetical protein